VTWRRALDLAYIVLGFLLIVLSLHYDSGSGYAWASGAGLVIGSVFRLAFPGYKFDPRKSGIQQWRERRRT